jgi:hypothetical protein
MKYFKMPKAKDVIEVKDENTYNLYVRAGFVECDKKGKELNAEITEENIEE